MPQKTKMEPGGKKMEYEVCKDCLYRDECYTWGSTDDADLDCLYKVTFDIEEV